METSFYYYMYNKLIGLIRVYQFYSLVKPENGYILNYDALE